MSYSPRLKDDYSKKIIKDLQGKLGLKKRDASPNFR